MKTEAETHSAERISFPPSPGQRETMEALAKKHQRSLSGEIRMALDVWIERCAAEEGTTA